ncbi:hypothetical protein KAR91_31035 [Candidatus Pacearchaeota archaeon]|nr:hypothetical protein [Candidatus Pacearchaeota archaeon]
MTSDYREALELCDDVIVPRKPALTKKREELLFNAIPEDRFVSLGELTEDMKHNDITKLQIQRRLRTWVSDKKIIKIKNLYNSKSDTRRVLYRRKGAMD